MVSFGKETADPVQQNVLILAKLGVAEAAVFSWDSGGVKQWHAIIDFLGEYPFSIQTDAKRLLAYRRGEEGRYGVLLKLLQ